MAEASNVGEISQYTRDKAVRTRLALESYYSQLIAQHAEREDRQKKLERIMADEGLCFWFPFIFSLAN